MTNELRFDDRVAIITGAGNGLGRSHALMLAARGAKVVVNDLGGDIHGDGSKSSAAADAVVEEIRAAGGEAVANYDSVEDGDKIVQTAMDTFGTVDIVVNNAGILRDISFHKMEDRDWDLVLRVHLTGSYKVSHAAWPILREKQYGRIIMTTSAAGLYGNFGQANYSAAKLGILGLANTLAIEGLRQNIRVNTIAPLAGSRLTETVMPPELLKALEPEFVSALVTWLANEQCEENGEVFEVGAGYVGKLRYERTIGGKFNIPNGKNPDQVAAHWKKVIDFGNSDHPQNTNDAFAPVIDVMNNPPKGGNKFIDLDAAGSEELVLENEYDERDLALYALGIGAARDPADAQERAFVYELAGDFQAFPTYGAMPQSNAMLAAAKAGKASLPGMNFGFDRLLHGEQYMELKRPLPKHAKLKHTFKLKEAWDKDPNALVTFAISSTDEQGREIAYNEMTAFVKGAGGWGGDRGPGGDVNTPPQREPDAVIVEKTDANQTLLYRLSGDWNPLHADPAFAKAFGFDRPILHGMCTFGYCGRHVIKAFADNDGRYFKSIKVRFAKSVFPGDTLETRMWKESDTRIVFETRVQERDEVVISNAAIELHAELPKEQPAEEAGSETASAATAAQPSAKQVVDLLAAYVGEHPELVGQVGKVYQWSVKNPDLDFVMDLKNGDGLVTVGTAEHDTSVELEESDLMALMRGEADAQKLYFAGKLKIGGDIMASQKLQFLADMDPAEVKAALDAAVSVRGASQSTQAQASAAPKRQAVAPAVFGALSERLAAGDRTGDVRGVIQFNVRSPEAGWAVALGDKPAVQETTAADADMIIGIDDADLQKLVTGEAQVRDLYQRGNLRVDGDIGLIRALDLLGELELATA